jgi:superfamily II DNA or RNA helicase
MKTSNVDQIISESSSWSALWELLKTPEKESNLSNKTKGDIFERLTQLYLQTGSEYATKLRHVWWHNQREVPEHIRTKLNLPTSDEGIDLVAETHDGEYWAIQSKFRSNPDDPLIRKDLGTFKELTWETCRGFSQAVVVHPIKKPMQKGYLAPRTTEIGLDRWLELSNDDWKRIQALCHKKHLLPLAPRKPRSHQLKAVEDASRHFVQSGQSRGRLIMPCGTGKSLVAFWIAERLCAKSILIAVPSLALIRQSLADWTREFLALGVIPDWLCVCSDETTGRIEQDEFWSTTYELGIPTTTDVEVIGDFLKKERRTPKVIFTTYQSSPRVAIAAKSKAHCFDLAILDEAHRTVGASDRVFSTLLNDERVRISKRLFMTATERVLQSSSDDVLSMDNEDVYGRCFHQLSFKEAIELNIISDYKISTVTVSSTTLKNAILENKRLNLDPENLSEAEAQSLAAGIALKSLMEQNIVRHAVSFHRSIKAAEYFRNQQDVLQNQRAKVRNLHISSKKTAGERAALLDEFRCVEKSLLTNARCLSEGVDIPEIDCVIFADPKQSVIDIVQAAGRALRRHKNKAMGYILLPIVVPDDMDLVDFADSTAFKRVARIITSLATQDERIVEEFRDTESRKSSDGAIVEIDGDVPLGIPISLEEFASQISTRLWSRIGKANWRSYVEARQFVHSLQLKSQKDWKEYVSSDRRPPDIPSNPNNVYATTGWVGYGDWLGTGAIATRDVQFLDFNSARDLVRSFGLKSTKEWIAFLKSDRRPPDIPTNPQKLYQDKGWRGLRDWLGIQAPRKTPFLDFADARDLVHSMRLQSFQEWLSFSKTDTFPGDLPKEPSQYYLGSGWEGWGDWLGIDLRSPKKIQFVDFESARTFARSLAIGSAGEWLSIAELGQLPFGVPSRPNTVYAADGWSGWGDWLGTGRVNNQRVEFREFESAKEFVHSLGLKSHNDWQSYLKSGLRPQDIPASPSKVYSNQGWMGWTDWLGTDGAMPQVRQFREFEAARAFVQSLGLKSIKDWYAYRKSGQCPDDIPSYPPRTYAELGWIGWADWLGHGSRQGD